MIYPARVRAYLSYFKRQRTPFAAAWKLTMRHNPCPEDWTEALGFMRDHMEAAYENAPGTAGTMRATLIDRESKRPEGRRAASPQMV